MTGITYVCLFHTNAFCRPSFMSVCFNEWTLWTFSVCELFSKWKPLTSFDLVHVFSYFQSSLKYTLGDFFEILWNLIDLFFSTKYKLLFNTFFIQFFKRTYVILFEIKRGIFWDKAGEFSVSGIWRLVAQLDELCLF